MSAPSHPIVLYDGTCSFCSRCVQFLLARLGVQGRLPDSVVLVEHGRVHVRLAATLRMCGHLRFPWPLFRVFLLVPRFLADPVYDWFARNRYRWFARQDRCLLPRPEWRDRFLDAGER
jgi:predicted DCC family thiol-disulfide oxidoreductase YuxK